jgi:hypothetical protein
MERLAGPAPAVAVKKMGAGRLIAAEIGQQRRFDGRKGVRMGQEQR